MAPRLNIAYQRVDELKLDPKNARRHTAKQIEQIARSIDSFGFNVPILIDADGVVIAGHGRLLACRKRNWKEVPTIRLDHLNETQLHAFMLADNRLCETAGWDEQLLAEQLRELSLVDLSFDIEDTGFDVGEIDLRIASLGGDVAEENPIDIAPDPGDGPPVTRLGDLWSLGEHRILCGNALDGAAYRMLLGEERAAVVFSDPPYNVPIDGHTGGLGAIHHRPFPMATGEMDEAEFTRFLQKVFTHLAAFSHPGSIHFICMDWRHLGEVLCAGRAAYDELKNICVWAKDNPGMGSLYRSQHEFVLVYKHGEERHRNNVQLGRFGRNRSNLWTYPGANSMSRSGKEGNLLAMHPTVKPVAMVADALLDCSAPRDIVLDAFLGSGTTVIAAERAGRRCFGLELDPLYVDVAIRRWQKTTGKIACDADGQSFDERAEAMEVRDAA